jgi:hypothetical protein
MANPTYDFDRWAEYLTVTVAENTARCDRGHNKVKKIQLNFNEQSPNPLDFKVTLSNELIARNSSHTQSNEDSSYPIDYSYQNPSSIALHGNAQDSTGKTFIQQATKLDNNFYGEGWALQLPGSIPNLLIQLSLRSTALMLPKQLEHLGVTLSDDFSVQFFKEGNYLSFFYEPLTSALRAQAALYLGNKRIKTLASGICFKHAKNRKWFMGL